MAPIFSRDTVVIRPFPVPDEVATPGLTANLVCRVGLAVLTNIICMVPLRLLARNREFAPVCFIVNNMAINCLTVVNAVMWPDDNMDEWWSGRGWCDLHPYLFVPMMTMFGTTVLAHSRELASKVGLLRASPLTAHEQRRKYLVQSLIIFTLPLVQVIWMYFITAQRYVVLALAGCDWRVHGSWPYIVFFALPSPILALVAGWYVILTWVRYREVAKTTRQAFMSNVSATKRQNRTKRRLYFFLITILVPYIPVQVASAAFNLKESFPLEPFDFRKIRQGDQFPWDSVVFVPSAEVGPVFMYNKFIPIFGGLVIFLYFGLTPDALACYRHVSARLGLDKCFPCFGQRSNDGGRKPGQGSMSWGTQTDTTDTTLTTFNKSPLDSSHQLSYIDDSSFSVSSPTSSRTSQGNVPVVSTATEPSIDAATATIAGASQGGEIARTPGYIPSMSEPDFKVLSDESSQDIADATDMIITADEEALVKTTQPDSNSNGNGNGNNRREPSTPLRGYFSTPASPDGQQPILTGAGGLTNPFIFRTQLNIQSASELFSLRLPRLFLRRHIGGGGDGDGDSKKNGGRDGSGKGDGAVKGSEPSRSGVTFAPSPSPRSINTTRSSAPPHSQIYPVSSTAADAIRPNRFRCAIPGRGIPADDHWRSPPEAGRAPTRICSRQGPCGDCAGCAGDDESQGLGSRVLEVVRQQRLRQTMEVEERENEGMARRKLQHQREFALRGERIAAAAAAEEEEGTGAAYAWPWPSRGR